MRTVISKMGKILVDEEGFYPMEPGELIFIGSVWYKVKSKTLHFPAKRLVIEVE